MLKGLNILSIYSPGNGGAGVSFCRSERYKCAGKARDARAFANARSHAGASTLERACAGTNNGLALARMSACVPRLSAPPRWGAFLATVWPGVVRKAWPGGSFSPANSSGQPGEPCLIRSGLGARSGLRGQAGLPAGSGCRGLRNRGACGTPALCCAGYIAVKYQLNTS